MFIKRGDLVAGVQVLATALRELPEHAFHTRYTEFLGEFAEALGRYGDTSQALAMIDKALDRSEKHEEGWCIAELLRIKGDILMKGVGADTAASAEEYFQRSLDLARRQAALAWELRAATGLARLWKTQARNHDAYIMLTQVYGRFTEGFETYDLRTAKALIDELA